jgi:hypothetical protein
MFRGKHCAGQQAPEGESRERGLRATLSAVAKAMLTTRGLPILVADGALAAQTERQHLLVARRDEGAKRARPSASLVIEEAPSVAANVSF